MKQIIYELLSEKYSVYDAKKISFDEIYSLYSSNRAYFEYFGLELSEELLKRDMTILPDGCSDQQKHFLAYYEEERLTAIIDIITGYPDDQTCYIGLFMVEETLHGRGKGTEIISGLRRYLGGIGYKALRLAYGKHYTSAKRFWTKNGFIPVREAVIEEYGEVFVAERKLDKI